MISNLAKNTIGVVLVFLAFFASVSSLFISIRPTAAQITPYQTTGVLQTSSINYHYILNVKKDDRVLISINSDEGGFNSEIKFFNLTTVLSFRQNAFGEYPGNPHIYQFIAEENGNYFLQLWNPSKALNYTIVSSHQVSTENPALITPYQTTGVLQTSSISYHYILNVMKDDRVLISVNSFEGGFNSEIKFYNLTTVLSFKQNAFGGYPGNPHIYQFIAQEDGTYFLQLWNPDKALNYTIISSHQVSTEPSASPTPLQSLSPSPTVTPATSPSTSLSPSSTPLPTESPTISPTFTATPFTINAVASGSVTFEVPSTYQSSGSNFTYDFGDGTNITTPNTSVTHVYKEPGNYTFTLKLEGAPEQRTIESYSVIVTGPSENPIVKYTWPIVTSVTAGLTVAAITAVLRRRKKKTQSPNPPPPPP
jgi:hypothetical protein